MTRLCVVTPARISSLLTTRLRLATLLFVYTASKVSKLLPTVSKITVPLVAGVHRYQTDFPPAFPAWSGSPASLVAPTLEPFVAPAGPLSRKALLNESFGGPVPNV